VAQQCATNVRRGGARLCMRNGVQATHSFDAWWRSRWVRDGGGLPRSVVQGNGPSHDELSGGSVAGRGDG
jgi:hypothetical protein